jgi:hypothetical protein
MNIRVQLRRGTESEWNSSNPALASGEIGVELDTGLFKIGNGTNDWRSLPYAAGQQGAFNGESALVSRRVFL